ncbi:MAG TPA: DUF3732 domain-containing protein [Acidimicrobiales bacterium]|nr:DUF3732 domain-containing protein [Acidimicrobiales bacterium]
MQLLSLAVYNREGARRDVPFEPGRLNIVTGESKTGKSALLDMVEYCLGRDTIMMPVGPITSTVVWYAALFLLPGGGRVFLARPAPREGSASTQQAMLEFGADLELLPFQRLVVNSDTRALREQLGRQIGIEENLTDPGEFSLRSPLEANLGHAALLCLQGQEEIANRNQLFHRQAEPGMEQALKDTLPYFLGAVARDQALRRLQLREAKRDLARIRSQIALAEAEALSADGQVRALLAEAVAVGLVGALGDDADRTSIVATLELASRQATVPETVQVADAGEDDGRRDLEQRRRALRDELQAATAERRLLLDAEAEENGYRAAASTQVARLASIELIPNAATGGEAGATCPVCSSQLAEADASADDLRESLEALRAQLAGLETVQPTRRLALGKLDDRVAALREELRVVEAAARAVADGDDSVDPTSASERREFTRGRISATLDVMRRIDDNTLTQLRRQAEVVSTRVDALTAELDDDEVAMQLDSRLLEIGSEMTAQGQRLSLEHSGAMRLDLSKLTVITETDQGPAPLWRVGSAENWIGAHVIAHLALHKFFTTRARPVPRFLMLDQPTQAWYPSEVEEWDGVPTEDTDREAVRAVFRLLLETVTELAPDFQVIVCDHANLPEDWFQGAVVHNWRSGEKLIPTDWIVSA